LNGKRLPGVTTVTGVLNKPGLLDWASDCGKRNVEWRDELESAGDRGTLAHTIIENYLLGKKTSYKDYTDIEKIHAKNSFKSFKKWHKAHNIDVIFVEQQLVSEEYQYGGTFDLYVSYPDENVFELIDIKTSKGIYPDHYYQVSAYKQLLVENGHIVDRCRILHLPIDTSDKYYEYTDINYGDFNVFLSCLSIYRNRR